MGPQGIHVAYIVIDAVIDLAWSFDVEVKPFGEVW